MNYRTLGRTGLKISIMGMGTGGGPDPLGQKSGRPESEARALLRRAYDLGINFFDTAPGYMESEVILGRALKEYPRDSYILSTKIPLAGGMPGEPMKVMKAEEIEPAVTRSLQRMQVDTIDLLLIGVAGPDHLQLVLDEHIPVLQRLQRAGKIRFLGSSELSRADGDHQWLQAILPHGVLDVAMVAHNMINQSAQDSVFPLCREMNLGVLNIFTVRRVFSVPGRLQEVVADLKQRGVIDPSVPDKDPLGWLVQSGEVATVIEAAYRYAAYTDGVSAVMNGATAVAMLEENIASVHKGPLKPETRERLHSMFGAVAEPIGN
jgi:L-galactose dehydrogenase